MSNEMKEKESQGFDALEKVIIDMITNKNIDELNNIDQAEKQVFSFLKNSSSQIFSETLQAIKMFADFWKEQQGQILAVCKKFIDEILKQESLLLSDVNELLGRASTKQKTELEEIKKTLESRQYGFSYMSEVTEILKRIRKEQESKTVRCAMYAEHQKLGKSTDAINDLFALFSNQGVNVEKKVIADKMGFNLTLSEQNALFAIQKCMSDRKYKPVLFVRDTPYYSIEIAEYLESYGVRKRTTKRGKNEFLSNERKEAIEALNALGQKKAVIRYERKYTDEKGKIRFDIIELDEEIVKLVKSYERLTEKEKESLLGTESGKAKKLTKIVFIPCQPLFDGIDNYFCLKDSDYRQKIRQIAKQENSEAINLFIDYLYVQASEKFRHKQGLIIRISPKELAYKLRMTKKIEQRQWKRIKKEIERAIAIAKELGYITESQLEKGSLQDEVYFFRLNHERFYIE